MVWGARKKRVGRGGKEEGERRGRVGEEKGRRKVREKKKREEDLLPSRHVHTCLSVMSDLQ